MPSDISVAVEEAADREGGEGVDACAILSPETVDMGGGLTGGEVNEDDMEDSDAVETVRVSEGGAPRLALLTVVGMERDEKDDRPEGEGARASCRGDIKENGWG